MTESPRVAAKDPAEEALLAEMNDLLEPLEVRGYRDLPERYPTLHVIGVPRSGTTLVTQLLASCLDIGYIDNLIAAFWKAPTVGIRLSRKLLGTGPRPSTFASVHGRTAGVTEPHEFGYFWRALLGYNDLSDHGPDFEERIDWQRVKRVLTNMTYAFERPIAFKSFWLSMHIARVQQVLPRTCFLRVRRDPVDNAISLLHLRKRLVGSEDQWASMRPCEYEWLRQLPPPAQVAGQVFFLERMMDRGIAAVDGHNVLEVKYEDVCTRPDDVLAEVCTLLQQNGARVAQRSARDRRFEVQCPGERAPAALVAAIRDALASFEKQAT